MNCRYCGSPLAPGAMFCGECGRTVAPSGGWYPAPPPAEEVAEEAAVEPVDDPQEPDPGSGGGEWYEVAEQFDTGARVDSESDVEPPSDSELEPGREILIEPRTSAEPAPEPDSEPAEDDPGHCPQCGAAMAQGDVFCGECGFVSRDVAVPGPEVDPMGAYPETSVLIFPPIAAVREGAVDFLLDGDDAFVGEHIEPAIEQDESPARAAPMARRPVPDPFPWGMDRVAPEAVETATTAEDIEATRVVSAGPVGERFVLQFSTGESVTVAGAGLVGRNPSAEPGEFVDQLIAVFDVGKSVSKTHLEFGQESGRFWVADRFSTNGSMVRQPDETPRRAEPGRRYFIGRGTRVDIGSSSSS